MISPQLCTKQLTSHFRERSTGKGEGKFLLYFFLNYKLNIMSDSKKRAVSTLDQLKNMTTVVADTGDFAGRYRLWSVRVTFSWPADSPTSRLLCHCYVNWYARKVFYVVLFIQHFFCELHKFAIVWNFRVVTLINPGFHWRRGSWSFLTCRPNSTNFKIYIPRFTGPHFNFSFTTSVYLSIKVY